MLTKKQLEKAGYTILGKSGWVRIDPEILPHDWDHLAKAYGFDPDCKEVILSIAAFKEVPYEDND